MGVTLIGDIEKEISNLRETLQRKKVEKKVLENVLKEREKEVPRTPYNVLVKKVRRLDYLISTSAISPKFERKIAKQIEQIEAKIAQWKEYNIVKRKIERMDSEIKGISKKLKRLEEEKREALDVSAPKKKKPKDVRIRSGEDVTFTIADIGIVKKVAKD